MKDLETYDPCYLKKLKFEIKKPKIYQIKFLVRSMFNQDHLDKGESLYTLYCDVTKQGKQRKQIRTTCMSISLACGNINYCLTDKYPEHS